MKATTALRKISGIYKITNPNNKIYIGQSVNVSKRLLDYKYLRCKSQILIYRSLIKYGVENHTFEIIEECSVDLLNERERYYQDFYNVTEFGLNLSLVNTETKKYVHSEISKTKISNSRTGIIFTEEHKQNIRVSRIGTKSSEETKLKLSIINKGKKPPSWKGKIKTNEHLQKISEKLKGRILSEVQKKEVSNNMKNSFMPYSFIILDIDSGVYYNSVSQLSELLHCNKSSLLKKINKNNHAKYKKV